MNASFKTVKYKYGAKPKLGAIAGVDFHESDCSGYVRWLLYGATHGKIKLASGSWHQQQWCKKNLTPVAYSTAQLKDSQLRIAFIPTAKNQVGHVWLVASGQTIECYGGHGAGRRPWNTPVLKNNCKSCYIVGKMVP